MQGGVGVALLLVIAIYFGAALFRRKFLSFFFDQLKTVSERQAAWFAREQQREAGGYVQRLGQLVGLARDLAVLRGAGLPLPGLPKLRWRRGAGAGDGGSPASAPDGVPMPAPTPEFAAGEGVRSEASRGPTLVFVSLGGGSEEGGGFGGRPAGARPGAFRGPVVDLGPDGYTVLAGDLAPARIEDSQPEGAAPAAPVGEEGPRAVRPIAAADAKSADPRRLAAGVLDLSPDQYTVLAGEMAPDRAAGPAGERFAPPPDGVPPGFGREERSREARGSGANGGTGAGEAAAAGPPRPAPGAPAVRGGGSPERWARAGQVGTPPVEWASGEGRPGRHAADARRLSPGPAFSGRLAPPGQGGAGPPDGASAPQPIGREPRADRPEPAAAAESSGRPSPSVDAPGFALGRHAAPAGDAAPARGEDAELRSEGGGVRAELARKAVRDGAAAGAMRPRAHIPPRLAAGVPQQPDRSEERGNENRNSG